MTKEKLLENLKWNMENQAIDLGWVQTKVLVLVGRDIDRLLECNNNCGCRESVINIESQDSENAV